MRKNTVGMNARIHHQLSLTLDYKGNNMELVNSQLLLAQASTKQQAALVAVGAEVQSRSAVQQAMVTLAAEQADKANKAAAGEILKVKRNKQEFLSGLATANVALQAQLDGNLALAAKANTADAYGDATDNYLPLVKIMTGTSPSLDKSLNEVPKDWVAIAAAPAATAATTA